MRLNSATTLLLAASTLSALHAEQRPLIGAEVFLDRADSPAQVESWFRTLAQHQMPLARIFAPPSKDLDLCDRYFRAAEKAGVKLTVTLGGEPSPETARWIGEVVERYRDSPALDSWILINEPGWAPRTGAAPEARFRTWLEAKYGSIGRLNEAWSSDFRDFASVRPAGTADRTFGGERAFLDWYTFGRTELTWHLRWIASQIRKHDTAHALHVNPHALGANMAANSQDLPAWREFLSSLGGSCHPGWHLGLFQRDQYALGVAWINDLIRGASEPKPYWITELQGGNNLQSASRPLDPTAQDIAQWMWTSIGSGADRIIFWLLNSRYRGTEAGEWSMLDFQGQPTERLEAAGKVAGVLNEQAGLFREARPVEAPITIILSLETMTLQERFAVTQPVMSTEGGHSKPLPGRDRNAHLLAAFAYYQVLHQMGVPVRVKFIHDYDWRRISSQRQLAILPNVAALSAQQAQDIAAFVKNGNSVLLTGLTGAYDPDNRFWPLEKFPLEDLLGATLKDIRTLNEECMVHLVKPEITLPSDLWIGEILNHDAEVIGRQNGWVTAIRKRVAGGGEAVWIPSTVDVAAWLGDNNGLRALVENVAGPFAQSVPFRFAGSQGHCLLRVLESGKSYVTVVTNGGMANERVRLVSPAGFSSKVLWGDPHSFDSGSGVISIGPRGTTVLVWSRT
ncbi:MAG: beta-galactosidase [Bryobacteraceae bacterium]|nr:beta-galactosidase [Bryobacteraceae bacterium]